MLSGIAPQSGGYQYYSQRNDYVTAFLQLIEFHRQLFTEVDYCIKRLAGGCRAVLNQLPVQAG
ncbi:hypothetical protein [Klebsiella aerogenes]|uniref:hypothetical protein n=1 Tax=Klebsiella aerogenes TaxID=548 RepID=UPI0007B3E461|nr:hypothetical protein [Klebsiella aerogenes]KZR05140.1 hypothetical protein A3N54_16405 [Klebsiella aerogenes]PMC22437.1 hypothetical protein CJ207_08740 [Klebsiella aerogenes]